MNEEWKQIVMNGIKYDYLISSHGRVFGLKRQKMLKLRNHHCGYLRVKLSKNDEESYFLVHRLVAEHFIPNDDETKTDVNHIDENKKNNHVENLEWCTRKQNINHGTRTERQTKTVLNKGRGKRVKCVETGQEFESINEASRTLGVDNSALRGCLKGRTKTCGGYHWEYLD